MKIIVSNKLEILARRLADELKKPLGSALAKEIIIIQSAGMQKWLSLEIARRHGICANYDFPFPNAFIDNIFQEFIADYRPDLSDHVDVMAWKVMEILPDMVADNDFRPVQNYLGRDFDQLKLFQLACKIAAAFDQYLIYRPEMILSWDEGRDILPQEKWQARLWRRLTADLGGMHRARLKQLFLSAVKHKPHRQDVLPQRISIFGISYLPPYHLEIFYELSRHLPVDLYYVNPSQEFWADIKSDREIGMAVKQATRGAADFDQQALHLERGNALLATMGGIGRDFFRIVGGLPTENVEIFDPPRETGLLAMIQADIYNLRDRGGDNAERTRIAANDESIQIHSCHGMLREVEVLHDILLSLMEKDKRLLPKDVLVMTPNIEAYAPYIEAVFAAREPQIPYSIADRNYLAGSIVFRGLFSLFALVESRFTVSDVLSFLENPAVSAKFSLNRSGLELIRHWAEGTKIRWGIDSGHKREFDLPEFAQNTWMAGLDRLLAGYALSGTAKQFYGNILPYGEIEGEQTEILGRFLDFWERLLQARNILRSGKTLGEWCGTLQDIMTDFFPVAAGCWDEISAVKKLLDKIMQEQKAAQLTATVGLHVIESYLRQNLNRLYRGTSFLTGGVTFCAMLPMRSIPFPVICLMGMNNEDYPRQERKSGFDLLELKSRAGDRSLRNEDRYLFLEAILAARKNLIITYTGQDAKDNSTIPPSVLVSELLDYIDRGFSVENGKILSAQLTRKHYLHGFNPAYFGATGNIFSYSGENLQTARAILTNQAVPYVFAKEKLNLSHRSVEKIDIGELVSFYRNPARYFLEKSLCLRLERQEESEETAEPFKISALDAYRIKQEITEKIFRGEENGNIAAVKKAEGILPVGAAGDYYWGSLESKTKGFAQKIASYRSGGKLADLAVDFTMGGRHWVGRIDNIYTQYHLHYRPARLKEQDYLQVWLRHLIINIMQPPQYPSASVLIGEDKSWQLVSVPDAVQYIEPLVEYYLTGLNLPLKYFPRASWKYAENLLLKKNTREAALAAARSEWFGDAGGRNQGEKDDIAGKICFDESDPLDEEFENISMAVLRGLFNHMEKLEL